MPTFNSPDEADNGLTRLLLRAVPPNDRGNRTVTHLAQLIHMSKAGVYKWLDAQKIPPERVVQIVEVSRIRGYGDDGKPILGKPRVKREEFDDFVYKAP